MEYQPGLLAPYVSRRMNWHEQNRTVSRLFDRDISLWGGTGAPGEEIANRLGWLGLPTESSTLIPDLDAVARELLDEGYDTAVLLGMGGSSLAPFVISSVQQSVSARPKNSLRLLVLDSTSPDQIQAVCDAIDLSRTVFLVSSKSGTTSETKALSDFFWQYTLQSGAEWPGGHFLTVTDPGSRVIEEARQKQYRAVIEANPDVGGRFSALSAFGLLPACLAGVNLESFLGSAQKAAMQCGPSAPPPENPALLLGTLLAEAAPLGMDKAVILADDELSSFGLWAEQLIAESTGKNGRGILPVAQEPIYQPEAYSRDRVFIYLRASGGHQPLVDSLVEAGRPTLIFDLNRLDDLSAQFYIWEAATAIACSLLEVNAFDQPNVQETKTLTKTKMELLRQTGSLGLPEPIYTDPFLDVRWNGASEGQNSTLKQILADFLALSRPGDYIALNAFLPDTDENQRLLRDLRRRLTGVTGLVTTAGFGPRYLHSTGQLHKGGKNNGLFLVITQESPSRLEIPADGMLFQQFILAQAAGDIEALNSRGRRVMHLHLKEPGQTARLINLIETPPSR